MQPRTIKVLTLTLLLAFASIHSTAQERIYQLHEHTDFSLLSSSAIGGAISLILTESKGSPGAENILSLNNEDVWRFDRMALDQQVSSRHDASMLSDIGLGVTFFAPLLMLFNERMRAEWIELAVIYTESQLIAFNAMQWSKALSNRYRPVSYYDEIPIGERNKPDNLNSFFSGHTTLTATASFFIAKVISDFNPELGAKKYIIFSAAVIPPAFVGFMRYKALKHFPTDVLTAITIGGASAILTAHFHKNTGKTGFSLRPVAGSMNGFTFRYSF